MPPGSEMTITTTFSPDRDEIRFIDQQLLQHNQDKIEGYAYEDVLVKSIDRDGNTAAGLHGRIGGGWLYVAGLWVDDFCGSHAKIYMRKYL